MNIPIDMSEKEFRLLRDFIHEKFGIYLKEEKLSYLRMKLYPRLIAGGLNSFTEYTRLLMKPGVGDAEVSRLPSLITNNETYFFRERPQLDLLRESLLPELKNQKVADRDHRLRILSAGCSSGEEVYTLAMLIFESASFFWGWEVEVIGIDIDEKALEIAREGIYSARSLRMTDPLYLNKFFTSNHHVFAVKEHIKKMTSFVEGNIVDPKTWETIRDLDIIFCRNVLIYFSEEKVNTALHYFHGALREGGYLLLGLSETLSGMISEFQPRRFPNAIIYQKKER